MFNIIFSCIVGLGVFSAIFISPAVMNYGLLKVSSSDNSVTPKETALCCIPVFNHFYGWNRYSGSYLSLSGISQLLLYVAYIVRMIVMFQFYDNESLQTVTILSMVILCVVFWIAHMIDIYRVLKDSGTYTTIGSFIIAISVFYGQFAIGLYMPSKIQFYFKKARSSDLYGRG